MKICWDNIEKIYLNRSQNFTDGKNIFIYEEHCLVCGEPFFRTKYECSGCCSRSCAGKNKKLSFIHKEKIARALKGRSFSEVHRKNLSASRCGITVTDETRKKISDAHKGKKFSMQHRQKLSENNGMSKGGVWKLGLPLYDTFSPQLDYAEETMLFVDNSGRRLLKVRCSKCDNWFVPTINAVQSRIRALKGEIWGECRFYCSQKCKDSCEVFGKRAIDYIDLTSKQKESVYSSEELSIWSKEVLNRANFKCEICGDTATDAHHIEPKKLQPMLSLDPDNGLALCKSCHYKYGHSGECSTGNLANIICN